MHNANLAENLIRSAARHGDKAALFCGTEGMSFADLDRRSAQVAGLLNERGLRPGDRVGVMLPNVVEFASIYYGVLRAGGVVVPMNILLKPREVAYHLGDAEASFVFAWHTCGDAASEGALEARSETIVVDPSTFGPLIEAVDPVEAAHERGADDTAVILYTSGTTGRPKGAELTHDNLGRNVDVIVDLLSIGAEDVVLGALPLFHSFGQTCGLNAAVATGASLALIPRFDPATVLELIGDRGVTVFEGVPTMYSALLNHPGLQAADTSTLRTCVSGGAALPVEVLKSFEEAFGCVILEGYGLSETSPVASFNDARLGRKPGSIGTPVTGVRMKLVNATDGVGEIAIRGHNVMKGYWKRPEATEEAIDAEGWFSTGDLARVDDDGYFFIVDRKKDLIIRGGYNVYPREVEEVLHEHPAVREVAVVGVPHDRHGEEIAAVVAVKDGAGEEDLRSFAKERLAAYKYPRIISIVDELPKGPTGKILKREIQLPAKVEET